MHNFHTKLKQFSTSHNTHVAS